VDENRISISKDFSPTPAGRYYPQDGDFPGELFRDTILVPSLKKYAKTIVNLDNDSGYGSSFIDEAFGGLLRESKFSRQYLREHLFLQAPEYNMIYVDEAIRDMDRASDE